MINVHSTRYDALIIRPGTTEILQVRLAYFSYEKATKSSTRWMNLIRSRNSNYSAFIKVAPKSDDTIAKALAVVWSEVVKPTLDFLGYTVRVALSLRTVQVLIIFLFQSGVPVDDMPHITWCTTGPLSFSPPHVAGNYGSHSMIYDYVISSYTPTLSALLTSEKKNLGCNRF